MSEPRGNLLALALTRVTRLLAGIGVTLIVARIGPEALGIHGWALSLANVAAFSAGFGLHLLMVRKVAREPDKAGHFLGVGVSYVLLTSIGMLVMVTAWAAWSDGRPAVVLVALLGAIAVALGVLGEVIAAVFHGLRRMRLELPAVVTGRLLYLGLAAAAVTGGLGLQGVFAAQVVGAVLTVGALAWIAGHAVGNWRPSASVSELRALFEETRPFGLNILFGAIYLSADTLMLKEFRPDDEVGWYRLAALLGLQLPVAAQILNRGLYPKLSKMADDASSATDELSFAVRVLLAASLPMAVGGMVLATPIVLLLGGSDAYAPAAPALVLLMPMLPLRFVNNGLGTALTALDRQEHRTRGVALAAAFNIVGNLIAIPIWGYLGAAATTVLTDLLLSIYLYANLRPVMPELSIAPSVLRAGVPSALMGALVFALPAMPVPIAVAVGVVAVLPLMRVTGAWQADDLRRLRAI